MEIEKDIRAALQEEANDIQANPQLRGRVMNRIYSMQQPKKKMKQRLLTVLIFLSLLVPTAGLASYQMFISQLYETKEQFLSIGGTEEEYYELESKLKEAKTILTEEEFKEFMILMKDFIYFTEKMSDSQGMMVESRLSEAEKVPYQELIEKLNPYFDKINEGSSVDDFKSVEIETVLEQLPFKIEAPSYVPNGFELEFELGIIPPANELEQKPYVQYTYKASQGEERFYIIVYEQQAILDEQEEFVFEVVDGLSVLHVKAEESKTGFSILIDGSLDEEEAEKIARSMIR